MTTPGDMDTRIGAADCTRLAELLERQETLFLRLDALSKRQSRLVQEERTDELLGVLGERQSVVDALEETSRAVEPFRARWDEVMSRARPEQRTRVRGQIERLAELAAAIAARDDADRHEIERRRDRLAGDLAGVGRTRGAVSAYGAPRGRPAARFQDTEG
jgi:hypothetical protein